MTTWRLTAIILWLSSPVAGAAPLLIDDFSYPDNAAARAAWQEGGGSLPVEMAASGPWGDERVMKLPCDFSVQTERSYWDRNVTLDLSGYRQFALEIFVSDPGAVSRFTIYFRSGSGWYGNGVSLTSPGWQTLYFSRRDFSVEGTPAGWEQIDGIRLSPWKEAARDTFLAVRQLRAFVPTVFIVRDTHTADDRTVDRTTKLIATWLGRYNVLAGTIDDVDVENGYLQGSGMAILPYNSTLSDASLAQLEQYVAAGGKLMVFYSLPERIATLLGIQNVGWTQGDFAAYSFNDDVIQYLPARVQQASWNITIAAAGGEYHSRVIAEWEDDRGVPTGYPAWLASDRGLFMSHIILGDDADNKQFMLLVLVGHYLPEIWPAAADAAIENIGRIADYRGYQEARDDIGTRGALTPRSSQVSDELSQAGSLRDQALALSSNGEFVPAIQTASGARAHLLEAYYLSQSPQRPEFRAVWEHAGTGPFPGDWQSAIDVLADNHFTALFTNMMRGGLAHYDSAYLPHSDSFEQYGDQLSACITAARRRGIQVHVWKVNWNLAAAPQSFIDDMRAAGRTQVDRYGDPVDWLCPSHPDNLALEHDVMMEVVQNYDVDGLHFDYIRYPNSDSCYCDGCRARFEQQTGHSVVDWPADVLEDGPLRSEFLDWRRRQITNLVEAVYRDVKATRPTVAVSAAVFSNYGYCRDGVGQDWVDWIDRGIVDFLCPMDYTNDFDHFTDIVGEQLGYAQGRLPIYPGIGASASSSSLGADGVIVQINTTRQLATGGFIIFNYDGNLAESVLPALGRGTTADELADGGSDGDGGHTDGGADGAVDGGADGSADAENHVDGYADGSAADGGIDAGTGEDAGAVAGGCGCSPGSAPGNAFPTVLLMLLILLLRLRPVGGKP